jgi:hypothetical protein
VALSLALALPVLVAMLELILHHWFYDLMDATPTCHLDANTRLTIHTMAVRRFDTHSDDAPGSGHRAGRRGTNR